MRRIRPYEAFLGSVAVAVAVAVAIAVAVAFAVDVAVAVAAVDALEAYNSQQLLTMLFHCRSLELWLSPMLADDIRDHAHLRDGVRHMHRSQQAASPCWDK